MGVDIETKTSPQVIGRTTLPLRRRGGRPPLFCIHAGSGFALPYAQLLAHLPPDVPVYGVQARGLTRPAVLPSSITEMAHDYATQIRDIFPTGPYRLLGWCFGGRISFEVARVLRDGGHDVDLLVLMDSFPPAGDAAPAPDEMLRDLLLPPGARTLDADLGALCRTPPDFVAIAAVLQRIAHPMRHLGAQMLATVYRIHCNGDRLNRSPITGPLDADMLFLAAVPDPARSYLRPGNWYPYLGGRLEVHQLSSRHDAMMQPGPLAEVGVVLLRELAVLHP